MRTIAFRILTLLALLAVSALGAAPGLDEGVDASSGWAFEGCFAYFAAGPCYDVFRDSSGRLWICKACGTTKNPNSHSCQVLSASGFWCS